MQSFDVVTNYQIQSIATQVVTRLVWIVFILKNSYSVELAFKHHKAPEYY